MPIQVNSNNGNSTFSPAVSSGIVAGFQGTNTDHPPLVDLTDVNKAGLNNNDVLVWSEAQSKWVPMDIGVVNDNDGGEF
tara:strand:+ start:2519 stop:2755 length:237 start_codon:yes stop_codon:yes gene_type:complete